MWQRCIAGGGAALLLITLASIHTAPLAGVYVAVYIAGGVWVWRLHTRQRVQETRDVLITDACAVLAADLCAGSTPHTALGSAAQRLWDRTHITEWRDVATAASTHSDIASALRRAGDATHSHRAPTVFTPVHAVAAAWELASTSGSSYAHTLRSVEQELTAAKTLLSELRVHTASARATTLILVALPTLGVSVGYALGADPLTTVFTSFLGIVCATVATALHAAGWWWAHSLLRSPEVWGVPEETPPPSRTWFVWGAALGTGVCTSVLIGGITGVLSGAAIAWGVWYGTRFLHTRTQSKQRVQDASLLSVALTLLAAELRAGQPVASALMRVARLTPAHIGTWWGTVAQKLHRGDTPRQAWQHTQHPALPHVESVIDAVLHSAHTGASCAQQCESLARRIQRENHTHLREVAAHRGVLLVLPLAFCFLPAFVLWGVIPTFLELFGAELNTTL